MKMKQTLDKHMFDRYDITDRNLRNKKMDFVKNETYSFGGKRKTDEEKTNFFGFPNRSEILQAGMKE